LEWLQREVAKALLSPEVKDRLVVQGVIPSGNTRDEFKKIMDEDAVRWSSIIKIANIKLQ